MIDFHTHILPGMDDGSQSVPESVSLLRLEAKQGVDLIMLTPHFYAEQNSPSDFLKRREQAWRKLRPYLWPELPRMILGAEVQYFEGMSQVEDVFRLRLEGTPFLLVEMPFDRWTERMVEEVLDVHSHPDTRVVLAHIERYMSYQNPGVGEKLLSHGVLMQSNITVFDNWRTRNRAISMMKNGQIHLLGSDCHNMRNRRPNWDNLPEKAWDLVQQSDAYRMLRRKYPVRC